MSARNSGEHDYFLIRNSLLLKIYGCQLWRTNAVTLTKFLKMRITFVPEYCSHVTNFAKNTDSSVAAIDVGFCHLLEISNRDENRKRTAFSLTHLTRFQLEFFEKGNLVSNLKEVACLFKESGGDLATAEVRIFGGTASKPHLRVNLKKCLGNALGIDVEKISEPRGHVMEEDTMCATYLFRADAVEWRKSNMKDPNSDPYLDKFSSHMKVGDAVDMKRVDAWQDKVDAAINLDSLGVDLEVATRERTMKASKAASILRDAAAAQREGIFASSDDVLNALKIKFVDNNSRVIAVDDMSKSPQSFSANVVSMSPNNKGIN
jgi:hypothetical protein